MGAYSHDLVKSFDAPFLIDETLTCPCRTETGDSTDDCRLVNGGFTQGLAALPNGDFVIVFPSDQNGKMKLKLATIKG